MYDQDLLEMNISLDKIYLDPNNPRFTNLKSKIPDKRAHEEQVQKNTDVSIQKEGVEELVGSIIQNGFLPLDRIVIRELEIGSGRYVAVEGNRRVAALKTVEKRISGALIEESDLNEEGQELLLESIQSIKCLVYTGAQSNDIAWILQGIRHISGIRDWSPAQRAELVSREIDEGGLKSRQVGQKLGISTQAVNRLYNANRGLQQMLSDEDYSSRAKKEYFTLFEEAHRRPNIRNWLGWNEASKNYENIDNLQTFYELVGEDPENGSKRRIHDPRQIGALEQLVKNNRTDLIDSVLQYAMPIDEAKGRLDESSAKHDWKAEIQRATKALESLPATMLMSQPKDVSSSLQSLADVIASLLAAVSAPKQGDSASETS
ncbi:ParB N-terminal domain-containing protein [Rhodococcus sp. BS-15]|uniref:ParB N-terminal domain-containing protein n=1 Tax=Rhodococcus sp. BS-15 TaxID=1304954 RepID=UPI000FFC707E|nr:ParB N-terminal domain-containing protein [Rhodococcus sp. BS-15]